MFFQKISRGVIKLANVARKICAFLFLLSQKRIDFSFEALIYPLREIGLWVMWGRMLNYDAHIVTESFKFVANKVFSIICQNLVWYPIPNKKFICQNFYDWPCFCVRNQKNSNHPVKRSFTVRMYLIPSIIGLRGPTRSSARVYHGST